ncbi:MAG: KR domain-containing protein [Bacteroidota bacterium]
MESIFRRIPTLKQLPYPDRLVSVLPYRNAYVIFSDDIEFFNPLVKILKKNQIEIVVICNSKTQSSISEEIKSVKLDNINDESIKNALKDAEHIIRRSLSGLLFFSCLGNDIFSPNLKAEVFSIRTAFLLSKRLKDLFYEKSEMFQIFFVSNFYGHPNIACGSALNGAYTGLANSLSLEWPDCNSRHIKFSTSYTHEEKAELLLSELFDPNLNFKEIIWHKRGRYALELKPLVPTITSYNPVSKAEVFAVDNIENEPTSSLVLELAKRYKPELLVVGKADISIPEDDWSRGIIEEKNLKEIIVNYLKSQNLNPLPIEVQKLYDSIIYKRTIQKIVQTLQEVGSKVTFYQETVFKEQMEKKKLQLGSISGVIFGSIKTTYKQIERKTIEEFEKIFFARIENFYNVFKAINLNELKYLIVFSSAGGKFGSFGQVEVAMTDEILNHVCYQIHDQNPGCIVKAFNWAPWNDENTSPQLRNLFAENGVISIEKDKAVQFFINELNIADTHIEVVYATKPVPNYSADSTLKTYLINRQLKLKLNPFLHDHEIGGNPVLPVVSSIAWIAESTANLYPGLYISAIENSKMFKGIVLNDDLIKDYHLEIKELEKSQDTIKCEGSIYSQNDYGNKVFHYRSEVILTKRKEEIPSFSLPTLPECNLKKNGDNYYTNGTLFHGKSFQGIKEVEIYGENYMRFQCNVKSVEDEMQGQFPINQINTFISDVQYQGLLIWAKYIYDAGSLPVKCNKVLVYQPLEFDKDYNVFFEMVTHSPTKLVANVTTYDMDSKVCLRSEGAEIIVSQELYYSKKGTERREQFDDI